MLVIAITRVLRTFFRQPILERRLATYVNTPYYRGPGGGGAVESPVEGPAKGVAEGAVEGAAEGAVKGVAEWLEEGTAKV